MDITKKYKVPVNNFFYTIKISYGVNNKNELYKRSRIIYGRFIDENEFEYNDVYNGKIQDDGLVKYCGIKDLLRDKEDNIYMIYTYDEVKKINDILKEDFQKVPMKYTDEESISYMLEKLGKK